jgi:hypothetical protein
MTDDLNIQTNDAGSEDISEVVYEIGRAHV